MTPTADKSPEFCTDDLRQRITNWARELGFADVSVANIELAPHAQRLHNWLEANHHGDMQFMAAHGSKRYRPEELVPGTVCVLTLRMDYLPGGAEPIKLLNEPEKAYISRYALGRDYHKLLRKRLSQLAKRIEQNIGGGQYRAFTDSAPVLERALAENSGLGWFGKNTMIIHHKAGSWFFLGEIYTNLPLPPDPPAPSRHCGTCTRCLDLCPTNAFTGPYSLDARRCISYLTIEHKGSIDHELRPLMGNRIYGCDDCQLVCPWNKFATPTDEDDFQPRHNLDDSALVDLFLWTEAEFLAKTEGSAIRRIGYKRWLRNIAVALGNAPSSPEVIAALVARLTFPSELVREHVSWGLSQHRASPDISPVRRPLRY